jgi:hypothetical protein
VAVDIDHKDSSQALFRHGSVASIHPLLALVGTVD